MLPEWAWTPGGFESLLTAAAERAAERQRPLVLVVDGLDEADPPGTGSAVRPALTAAGRAYRRRHVPDRPFTRAA